MAPQGYALERRRPGLGSDLFHGYRHLFGSLSIVLGKGQAEEVGTEKGQHGHGPDTGKKVPGVAQNGEGRLRLTSSLQEERPCEHHPFQSALRTRPGELRLGRGYGPFRLLQIAPV
jgi:hypothetical protein